MVAHRIKIRIVLRPLYFFVAKFGEALLEQVQGGVNIP